MKVLFVTPFINVSGGGVAEVVKLVDAAVRDREGVETEIWALDTGEPSHATTAPIRLFRMLPPRRFGFSPALFFALLRSKADIVHVHGIWMFHVAAVYLAALLTGKPYVVTPHGMLEPWILRRSPKLKTVVSLLFQNAFLRRARAVQALTPNEVEDIERFLPGTRTTVIPNYITWSGAVDDQPLGWWKPEFAGKDIYLFLARINVKKGYRELLAAWDQACRDDAGFRDRSVLVFCGWLDGADDFAHLVDVAASAHGNVVYGGAQYGDDKARSLAVADFVVLPSHSEGLPMTVLEAWAAGKPVLMTQACNVTIGFRAGAARELVLDRDACAAGLRAAGALSADERQEMGDKARRLAEAEFSRESVASALIEMYRAAIPPKETDAMSLLDAKISSSVVGKPSFSLKHRVFRGVWGLTWLVLASWTPPPLHSWRRFLLRLFGAKIAATARIYGSTKVWYPPNLEMGQHSVIGWGTLVYNQDRVVLEEFANVAQRAHLCTGSHDIDDPYFQLITKPIIICRHAWVASDAFVGPGVTLEEGAVLGGRGVTFKSLPAWTVFGGNPAREIRKRTPLP